MARSARRSPAGRLVRAAATTCVLGLLLGCGAPSETRPRAVGPMGTARTSGCAAHRFTRAEARRVLHLADTRLRATLRTTPVGRFPGLTDRSGTWQPTSARAWTSGFLAGTLWLAFRHTHRSAYRSAASAWTRAEESQAGDRSTHDVGFKILTSVGTGYDVTHRAAYRRVLARAASSLASRYDPTVGAIRSWGRRDGRHHFRVIVDGLMNDELLFGVGRAEHQRRWTRIATRHALTTARHFVRADGSVIHLVDFDPRTGRVQHTANPQGFSPDSTWSRGQAWALTGFGTAYRYTGRRGLLRAARRTAAYFVGHVPADCVPYWDFDAPGIPHADTDSSAAAIAADGLLQLSRVEVSRTRRHRDARAAGSILASLARSYVAPQGEAVLTGATATHGVQPGDIGTVFGDYYLVRAVDQWLRQHTPHRHHRHHPRWRPAPPVVSGRPASTARIR